MNQIYRERTEDQGMVGSDSYFLLKVHPLFIGRKNVRFRGLNAHESPQGTSRATRFDRCVLGERYDF